MQGQPTALGQRGHLHLVPVPPPLTVTTDTDAWDAGVELAMAAAVERYIASSPPPVDSQVAADIEEWAVRLRADGERRLQRHGHQRVALAGEPRSC